MILFHMNIKRSLRCDFTYIRWGTWILCVVVLRGDVILFHIFHTEYILRSFIFPRGIQLNIGYLELIGHDSGLINEAHQRRLACE